MNGYVVAVIGAILLVAGIVGITNLTGDGGMERITTLSGVYTVCKPDNYPAVCFANKSGGGFSCVTYMGDCK